MYKLSFFEIDHVCTDPSTTLRTRCHEPDKRHEYGFRPDRNAHQAVQQAQKNIHAGYGHIVDIDLKSFFDEVDHCIHLQQGWVNYFRMASLTGKLKDWKAGFATGYATAFGTTGRSPSEKGKPNPFGV